MNRKAKKLSISIDTLFRENYNTTSASNFIYTFPSPIENVLNMKISAIEIPNFWYSFSDSKKSNRMTITLYNYKLADKNNINNPPILFNSTPYIITIPEGNYSNIDFANIMNAYFLNVGDGLKYIILEIDVTTGKTIFRARNPIDDPDIPAPYDQSHPFYSPNFYFSLDFRVPEDMDRPLYKNMGWTLGFIKSFYLVTFEQSYATMFIPNTLVNQKNLITFNAFCKSESVYGSSIFNYIFIDIDDGNKTFSDDMILSSLSNNYLEGNNIMGRITVHTSSNNINLTTGSEFILKTREYYGPVTLTDLNIRLLDKFGDLLELNGNDFSFMIEFTTINK